MKRNTPNSNGNVVPFTPPEPGDGDIKEEDRPGLEEILAMLVEMDDVQYDRCRHAKAQDWGIELKTLDRIRAQAKRVRAYRAKQKQHPEADPKDLAARLQRILETEGILDLG